MPSFRDRLAGGRIGVLSALAAGATLMAAPVGAASLLDDDGWQISWDNTLKYSAAFRTKNPSDQVINGPVVNGLTAAQRDDGDRNFRKGPISNRVDLLSEFDVNYQKTYGFRASAAAWYDTVYNSATDNNSNGTYNQPGTISNRDFPSKTRQLHGRNIELLDAFAYGRSEIADMPINLRLGRYAQLWGESLYFGNNGIAAGMAPLDTIKALSVPGSQVKELIMPVAQVGGQLQVTPNVSLAAYYQLEWRRNRNAGVGSFFSPVDFVDYGGSCLFGMAVPDRTCVGPRQSDRKPKGASGQYGASVKYTPDDGDYSVGLYALRFNAKDPVVYTPLTRAFTPEYYLAFPEGIELYGASYTTNIGDANVGGEVSFRRNQPLAYDPNVGLVLFPGQQGDGKDNRWYPTGDTLHAQFSGLYALPRSDAGLWDGGTVTGELAFNHVVNTHNNNSAVSLLDPAKSRSAAALQVGVMFDYYQVMPGLDVSVGPNVRFGLFGDSLIDPGMSRKSGTVSLAATLTYQTVWKGGLSYTHFVGDLARQPFADRDFIGFNVQRTF
ncbi:DUF1302 domain-containing protein [Azospirillum agricola]|uniref:DUF1302 domain-containing protein n=1 Tax=Azospirillum agricola TaxID=1720247 RepID=UPI000A0F2807|nr:DUF1302 family protein [Azospirillum agricola]SMH37346.1 Protein of unknown function [Azospirillum lipoferum]